MSDSDLIIRVAAKGDGVTADGRHAALAAPGDWLRADGYIHLSYRSQLAATLDKHFRNLDGLQLAAVDLSQLADTVRWEPARGGQPVDVAETATFLAMPKAAAVTGQVLRVCGQNLVGA